MFRNHLRRSLPWRASGAALLLIGAACCGCGDDGRGGAAVSGRVWLDGELLASGSVVFTPAQGERGPRCAALVVDGQFAISSAEGPLPGRHKVQVYAVEENAVAMDDPLDYAANAPLEPPPNRVDARFNEDSELEVAVSSSEPNEFQFEVQSTPSRPAR